MIVTSHDFARLYFTDNHSEDSHLSGQYGTNSCSQNGLMDPDETGCKFGQLIGSTAKSGH